MTKLGKNFQYKSLLEQAGVANVSSCSRDQENPVQCKQGYNIAKKCLNNA